MQRVANWLRTCDWSNRTEKENSVCKTKNSIRLLRSTPTRPGRNLTRTFPKTEPKFGLQNFPNIRSRSFRSAMSETRLRRESCQSSNRLALFHVLPTLSFLHIFLFPVTSETASRSLSRGSWCSAVSRATLFCRSSPTETGQSPRSPMSIRLSALLWAPEASQACNGRSWKKRGHAREEREWRQKRLSCNVKKTRRLEETKEDRCLTSTLARWCVGMNVDIVNVQSFFPLFQSCWALLLFSKREVSRSCCWIEATTASLPLHERHCDTKSAMSCSPGHHHYIWFALERPCCHYTEESCACTTPVSYPRIMHL